MAGQVCCAPAGTLRAGASALASFRQAGVDSGPMRNPAMSSTAIWVMTRLLIIPDKIGSREAKVKSPD